MKKTLNRWMYIIIGTFILIFSGLVYAWTTLAAPIQARFPEWSDGLSPFLTNMDERGDGFVAFR